MYDEKEIKVPVKDGYLIARRNPDLDYDGIYIVYETKDGIDVDIALVECRTAEYKKKINVYTYGEVQSEDFTDKRVLDIDDINDIMRKIDPDLT